MNDFAVGELVVIDWLDSGYSIQQGWETVDETKKRIAAEDAMSASTVGYYLGQQGEAILVAQSWDRHNDKYMNAQAVHLPCVKSITRVGPDD